MRVSLFVTCLVDQMFPQVGEATVELLTRLGVEVTFNPEQTCCGQPAFNNGHRREAREVGAYTLRVFERELMSSDYIVVPSGSCATMIKNLYPKLFGEDAVKEATAKRIAPRVFELSQFIVDVLGIEDADTSRSGCVTYHDSCHLKRELDVSSAPRKLLSSVRGVEFVEMDRADVCCGFGGTFSVTFPELSTAIAQEKIASIERSRAETVVACDSSCLMQINGLLQQRGSNVRCMHLAEFLAARES